MANQLEISQILEAMKLTAITAREHSEQLGLILANQKKQDECIEALQNDVRLINNRMESYEDRLRVTNSQAQNIRNSIHAKAAQLLSIEYKNGIIANSEGLYNDKYYRSGFISRCYVDARKQSKLGTPYRETLQRDYEEVLEYINSWEPPTGTTGYKAYLDARRRK